MKVRLKPCDFVYLSLLRQAPFTRGERGWRFGIRPLSAHVIARLIEHGLAACDGDTAWIRLPEAAE